MIFFIITIFDLYVLFEMIKAKGLKLFMYIFEKKKNRIKIDH